MDAWLNFRILNVQRIKRDWIPKLVRDSQRVIDMEKICKLWEKKSGGGGGTEAVLKSFFFFFAEKLHM